MSQTHLAGAVSLSVPSAPPHPSASPGGSTCRTIQNLLLPHSPRLLPGPNHASPPPNGCGPLLCPHPQSALHTPQPDHISSHPALLHSLRGHPSGNTCPCQALMTSQSHFLPPCSLLPTTLQPTGLPIVSHTPRPFLPLLLLVLPSRTLFLMATRLPHLTQDL